MPYPYSQQQGKEYIPPDIIGEFTSGLPLSESANKFVAWVQRHKLKSSIGPRGLFYFLVGWCQTQDQPLTSFIRTEFPEAPENSIVEAITFFERNQPTPNDFGQPYITGDGQRVFFTAQELVSTLRANKIEPHHLFASLLLTAAKEDKLDAFLGLEPGRLRELQQSFLAHVKEQGYGEAWAYWEQAFQSAGDKGSEETPVAKSPFGDRMDARRNAKDDELCLDIGPFSEAIAETFTAAAEDDDFVFALYGPWGRGKSTMIERVAAILGGDEKAGAPGRGYQPIFFSAWKYPTRPEVWVHLYQSIAAVALGNKSGFQKLRVCFRIGLLKHGWWPLMGGLALFAVSRLYFEIGQWFFTGVGLLGLIIVGSFIWSAIGTGKRFARSYFSVPDHEDKLGLQAVIGKDLKQLLEIWVTPRNSTEPPNRVCDFSIWPAKWAMVVTIGLIWITLGLVAWKLQRHIPNKEVATMAMQPSSTSGQHSGMSLEVFPGRETNTARLSWGAASPATKTNAAYSDSPLSPTVQIGPQDVKLSWTKSDASRQNGLPKEGAQRSTFILAQASLGFLALAAVALAWVITRKPIQPERVLLVVDDLDRCEPDQMLAVIESLRLFLDQPEMSRRLQVVMLLDRGIFKRAIIEKGKRCHMLADSSLATASKFFREQEEKFFVASLILPELNSQQVADLAGRVVDREYRRQLQEESDRLTVIETGPEPGPRYENRTRRYSRGPNENKMYDGHRAVRFSDHSVLVEILPTAEQITAWEDEKKAAKAKNIQIKSELDSYTKTDRRSQQHEITPGKITFEPEERHELKNVFRQLNHCEVTPRSLRAFTLRYQLVRLLLRKLGHEVIPSREIAALAAQLHPNSSIAKPILPAPVQLVIDSVTGKIDGQV